MKIPKSISDINNLAPEYIFLALGLIFGLMMVYANPPFHSNDEDRHYYLAYHFSTGEFAPVVQNGKAGFILPKNLISITTQTQSLNYAAVQKVFRKKIDADKLVPLDAENKMFLELTTYINPLPYAASAIGISIGRNLDDNPISLLWAGRTANLIFYLLIVFYSIRIIPIHKVTLMMCALTPMALYQASSITYDVFLLSGIILIISLIINYNFSLHKIELKHVLILIAIAFLTRFAKDGYIFIPFIALIIPVNKFRSRTLFYLLLGGLVLAAFLPGAIWSAIYNSLNLPPSKPFIRDFVYGTSLNLDYQMSNPFLFLSNLFMNILVQGQEWIWGTMGRFGYSYTIMSKGVLFVYGLALLTLAFIDGNKVFDFDLKQRLILLIIAFLNIMAIIAGFYIYSSPVGSNLVFGVQGRYFIPIIPVLLLSIANKNFQKPIFENNKNIIVGIFMIIILSYTILFLNNNLWVQ